MLRQALFVAAASAVAYLIMTRFNVAPTSTIDQQRQIIVVGGGAAGLAASVEALRAGAVVHLFDKEKNVGGNSAKASSGMNAANTPAQQESGVQDSPELFAADTHEGGGKHGDPNLIQALASDSAQAIALLGELGVDMSVLSQCGGHSVSRTHRPKIVPGKRPMNTGMEIIAGFRNFLERDDNKDRFVLHTKTKITQLVKRDGKIVGVAGEDGEGSKIEMKAAAVILATGGYCSNPTLVRRFAPELSKLPTTNGPFAQGEGLLLAEAVGASLVHPERIQVHPTGFVDPSDPHNPVKWLAGEAMRGSGALLLDTQGRRFVNELTYRDKVTEGIFANGKKLVHEDGTESFTVAYMIMNEAATAKFPIPGIYHKKGFVRSFDSAAALSDDMGWIPGSLQATFESYANASAAGTDAFGKTFFPVTYTSDEKLYLMTVTPATHYVMGGLGINSDAQVIGTDGAVIEGLYAAGEITGGVHGENRLAGNGLLDNIVFGRRAATAATRRS